jgi:hypothetical protein
MGSHHWLMALVSERQRMTRRAGRRRNRRRTHSVNRLLRAERLEDRTLLAAVLATVPAPGGPMVDTGTDISVYFDGPMDEATLTEDNVTVVGSQSGQHTAEFRYTADAFALEIDPLSEFAHDETVTFTLTTGVTGEDGDPLAADYSFSFHTLRGPSVLATSPVAGGPRLDPGNRPRKKNRPSWSSGIASSSSRPLGR